LVVGSNPTRLAELQWATIRRAGLLGQGALPWQPGAGDERQHGTDDDHVDADARAVG
jgi:hypothetical protein